MTTDVAVIGAGPTGLALACELVRHGVRCVVIDENAAITPFSKALAVQARTLEIYEQLGIGRDAIERGAVARKARMLVGGRIRVELPLADVGQGESPYPFVLMLAQSENEELLYAYLQRNGHDVQWGTKLTALAQDASGVTATVTSATGEPSTIRAAYLVGCDGAKSVVRHALGLSFEGSTFGRLYYVADARVDWELPHDALHLFLAPDVFTAFFPMRGEHRYRLVGTFPDDATYEEGAVPYDVIAQQVEREAQMPLRISDVQWFSTYKVYARRVDRFAKGRCFVAGDAAHIHSPAGGQGMNTGIQDAYNLAWKLAWVLDGFADPRLLATYDEERLPNAARLLKTTDRIFALGAGSHWLLSRLRTTVLPEVAGALLRLARVRTAVFRLISQTGITYRRSSLSDHGADATFRVKAGDRMPYVVVDGRSLYDALGEPRFHLVTFTDERDGATAGDVEGELARQLDRAVVPLVPAVREAFGASTVFSVLLRPDNHLASIWSGPSSAPARRYLEALAGRAKETS